MSKIFGYLFDYVPIVSRRCEILKKISTPTENDLNLIKKRDLNTFWTFPVWRHNLYVPRENCHVLHSHLRRSLRVARTLHFVLVQPPRLGLFLFWSYHRFRDGENRSAYWKFLEISENFLTISYNVFLNLFSTKKD